MTFPLFGRRTKLRYGTNRHQFGVLRLPRRRDEPAPVAVVVHGGSWSTPYNRWVMTLVSLDRRRRGWATFDVEYRRLGRGGGDGGWPSTFDDVRDAIDLIAAGSHERADDVDADRLVVIGHSAGGHLALTAVSASTTARPLVVVSIAGPTDLERMWNNDSPLVLALLADAPDDDRWSTTSPMHMLPIGVPVACIHGSADTVVDLAHSRRYVEAAKLAGDDAELVVVPDGVHRDGVLPWTATWRAVRAALPE